MANRTLDVRWMNEYIEPQQVLGILTQYYGNQIDSTRQPQSATKSRLQTSSRKLEKSTDLYWDLRFHGERNTGKTSISKALCRLEVSSTDAVSETPGLIIRDTIIPIKFVGEDKTHNVHLQMHDVGAYVQARRTYLKFNPSIRQHSAHIVVFSMTDPTSLTSAKQTIESLQAEHKIPSERILCVGTKIDFFHSLQVTEMDIESLVEENKITLCLVNTTDKWDSEYGVLNIINQLCDMLIQ
ncbi:hypothetical protein AKO1_014988 [Acrasis kona]|uniref:G domain-containing protein n=1 Tax=Acrasis kona TaxID=1008807 RepID=A0AAW2Z103_9EUKA